MVNSSDRYSGPVPLNDREAQGGKLIIYSLHDRKPVQWAKKKGNMAMPWRFEENTCSVILNFFESI